MSVDISPEQARVEKGVCDHLVERIMTSTHSLQNKSTEATPRWRGPAYNAFAATVAKFAKNTNALAHSIQGLGEGLGKSATVHEHKEAQQASEFGGVV
ncbi:WXG100 family type VII secretion target [Mycobacteroides abscessus subsp. abscessus]|nr:WXG100 family type VII secretion target [Mycobacteroides abscessus subsp. abscessus]